MERLTTPYLLLAAPMLGDPNFAKSVVLVGHHTRAGALGWVVNRMLDTCAGEVLPRDLLEHVHPRTHLRFGGPVSTNGLTVLLRGDFPDVPTQEVAPGLHVASTKEIPDGVFHDPEATEIEGLLVLGYAGWGAGQMEKELAEGAWFLLPYDEDFAFTRETDDLWDRALARLGVRPGTTSSPTGWVN